MQKLIAVVAVNADALAIINQGMGDEFRRS